MILILSMGIIIAYIDRANLSVALATSEFRSTFHLTDSRYSFRLAGRLDDQPAEQNLQRHEKRSRSFGFILASTEVFGAWTGSQPAKRFGAIYA
jgi:hypothetical protein